MADDENDIFVAPPEAPIFTPSEAEFADPIAYIANTIRPVIEKTGICKIRPPEDWQPPFAIDVEKFKFQPRIQKINELEATTRVKLNFLKKLFKFWELQGVILKVPTVNRKPLDLYKLHKIVEEEGGYEALTERHRWSHIACNKMHMPDLPNKCYGSALRTHYTKLLYPYDLFQAGVTYDSKAAQRILAKQAQQKSPKKESDIDYSMNAEMRKLRYHGAGRKVAMPSLKTGEENTECDRAMRDRSKASYLESDICRICNLTENEREMLTCCQCDEVYHKYCLFPKVEELLEGYWRCPRCVAKEYKKPSEAFGFDTSTNVYCLASFGAMADKFKETYFAKPVAEVKTSEVEQEFWRLTKSINENVTVQYGADIHGLTNGSGFPTELTSDKLSPEDKKYIDSMWNLNKLPVDNRSVLKFVSGDVSGMKVPWCYVGMCFSSFCWHIEDHWSYSINYHHWGEPKTWYGVPSSHAEALEETMKSGAPELFEQSPDLLHHITTIMNPNILMSHHIPVVRTDQCAGEFIVTAPRAFHAGFNQGYNFAEAVNFCPADWLPMGRACISSYKKVKRLCVFSHEELICKMAAHAQSLDLQVALQAHKELLVIVDQERRLRKKLLEYGITKAEREQFETKADDERQCSFCKTTCFLSAITCPCKAGSVVCIEHVAQLCQCAGTKKCLRYRYTLDELPAVIQDLSDRVGYYTQWKSAVKRALSATGKSKISFYELKALLIEGKENGYFPQSSLFLSLQKAVKEAEKYIAIVKETVNRRVRSRRTTDLAVKSAAKRLTLTDLDSLLETLETVACQVKDVEQLQELARKVSQFRMDANSALLMEPPQRRTLEDLLEVGMSLDIDMSETSHLERAIEQRKWIEQVTEALEQDEDDLVTVEELESLLTRGNTLAPHPDIEKILVEVEQILKIGQSWEEKASICLQAKPKHTLSAIEALLSESEGVRVYLCNMETLREQTQRSMEWIAKAEVMLKSLPRPTLEQLKNHIVKAKAIPVKLDLLPDVNTVVEQADGWKQSACRNFLKPRSDASLLEVLLPRYTSATPRRRHQQKKPSKQQQKEDNNIVSERLIDNTFSTHDMYEKAAQAELAAIQELRLSSDLHPRSCICGTESTSKLFQCALCTQWQHYKCSPANRFNQDRCHAENRLCSECVRSKRPKLHVILHLLVTLRKIPAKFMEGEALQSLTERAIKWQEGARRYMSGHKYVALGEKFTVLEEKNKYWAGQEEEEEELVDSSFILDHDYMESAVVPQTPKVVHPTFDVPSIEPDEEFCEGLDSILLEGRLLEVTIDELSALSLFKLTLQRYKLNGLAVAPNKRRKSVQSANRRTEQEPEISSTTNGADGVRSTESDQPSRKRRTRSDKGVRKKRKDSVTSEAKSAADELDSWGDYDEHCAAANGCLQPDDESICWVQCGRCELWFHLTCVGLHSKQLTDEDYNCESCKPSPGRFEFTFDVDVAKPSMDYLQMEQSTDSEPSDEGSN